MSRFRPFILAAAVFLPAPAFAQQMPSGAEIEAMAPALDRMAGALLDIDVGGIIDAADPYARRPGYGRPGRTIGNIARAPRSVFRRPAARLHLWRHGAGGADGRRLRHGDAGAPPLARRGARGDRRRGRRLSSRRAAAAAIDRSATERPDSIRRWTGAARSAKDRPQRCGSSTNSRSAPFPARSG